MIETFYLDVISGRRRGLAAVLLRGLLTAGVPFYAVASDVRNRLFDLGWKKAHQVGIPVISVGNLTTGGTGKTPVVAWVVNELLRQGRRPAIVSRGFRALNTLEQADHSVRNTETGTGQEAANRAHHSPRNLTGNDEKLLLELLCPGVAHEQDRDRVAAAKRVIGSLSTEAADATRPVRAAADCDVIVLDDGFQHRRLHRDLDIVLIDALNPWGGDSLLPRGLLRERVGNLRRADVVLITRSELATRERTDEIRQQLASATEAPVIATTFSATRLINADSTTVGIESCAGKRVCAFCGIGHPEAFRRTLAGIGAPVSDDRFRILGDHHHYTEGELQRMAQWADEENADCLLTTRKDLVKLQRTHLGGIPLWSVDIELTFRDPPTPLLDRLATDNTRPE